MSVQSESQEVEQEEQPKQQQVDDPVARFIARYWRQLLTIALAVLAVWYVRVSLKENYEQSMRSAADTFSKVREEFSGLLTLRDKIDSLARASKESSPKDAAPGSDKGAQASKDTDENLKTAQRDYSDAKKRLEERLVALADSRPPYRTISTIYQGLIASIDGDVERAKTILGDQDFSKYPADSKSSERYFAELASLALAKALVDDEKTYAEGRALLRRLAEQGQTFNVAAGVTLARISLTDDERKEAAGIRELLRNSNPENAALLDAETAG